MITETGLMIIKVFLPAVLSFAAGLMFAPAWVNILITNRMWKTRSKSKTVDGREATVFKQLHHHKETNQTPRMGGVVVWATTIAVALILWVLSQVLPQSELLARLDFISRGQTWLPLFVLLLGATVGLVDDYLEVNPNKSLPIQGLSLRWRVGIVSLIGLACGWWFYTRLDYQSLIVPFLGDINLGWLMIPFFVIVMVATYSGGVIDGIDGLSGGVFSSIFGAFGVIALLQSQLNLATMCFVISGALLAFLWFNLPPARYYMTETGTMALTMCLAVIAFMTEQVLLLPIIAMPLVVTPLSNIVQLSYRKIYGKKLFHITPIHHHFEALGIPSYQITMKYWIVSLICGLSGIILFLVS